MTEKTNPEIADSRRGFIKKSSAAAAVAGVSMPYFNANAQDDKKLKIGIVGCGGRGSGAAAQALRADDNCELWAMGDLSADIIEKQSEKVAKEMTKAKTPEKMNLGSRKFVGLDAYKQVIDSGIDVILLTTPPGFRPQHFEAAVEAGIHCFVEKPCATDVAGVKRFMAAGRKAKDKNLSVLSGLCYRYSDHCRELHKRINDGAIGDIQAIDAVYYTNMVKAMPPESERPAGMSDTEWQVRNWYNYTWLGGDGIVEQGIHSVDKVLWAMGDDLEGLKVYAQGGRNRPNNVCNTWDHFHVSFVWPSGVRAHVDWTQWAADQPGFRENTDYILGSKGSANYTFSAGEIEAEGDNAWKYRPPREGGVSPYQIEHNELFANIRRGERHGDEEWIARTTMVGIMARYAAYTGEEMTFDKISAIDEKLVPDVIDWDAPLPVRPIQVPGVTPYPPKSA
ncbi:MAG: putative dehydrogenase [Verrucomicrobiales bacterium]|jgi:predicted dehydrogenase